MDGNHLIDTGPLQEQGNVMKFQALIEYATTGYEFKDENYAHHHHLPLNLLRSARDLTVIDGRHVTLWARMHIICRHLTIHNP
jgi:hypothetical protein